MRTRAGVWIFFTLPAYSDSKPWLVKLSGILYYADPREALLKALAE